MPKTIASRQLSLPGGLVYVVENLTRAGSLAARHFYDLVHHAEDEEHRPAIALSGGSTPQAFYRALRHAHDFEEISWATLLFCFADERMVPPDHERSNFGLAEKELFRHLPAKPEILRPKTEDGNLAAACSDYSDRLYHEVHLTHHEMPCLDLAVLGMGADGHTASLFPGHEAARDYTRAVVTCTAPLSAAGDNPGEERISLSLPTLNAARRVWFIVTGADKAETLTKILAGDCDLPAAQIRPQRGRPAWIVDEAAAAFLGDIDPVDEE